MQTIGNISKSLCSVLLNSGNRLESKINIPEIIINKSGSNLATVVII